MNDIKRVCSGVAFILALVMVVAVDMPSRYKNFGVDILSDEHWDDAESGIDVNETVGVDSFVNEYQDKIADKSDDKEKVGVDSFDYDYQNNPAENIDVNEKVGVDSFDDDYRKNPADNIDVNELVDVDSFINEYRDKRADKSNDKEKVGVDIFDHDYQNNPAENIDVNETGGVDSFDDEYQYKNVEKTKKDITDFVSGGNKKDNNKIIEYSFEYEFSDEDRLNVGEELMSESFRGAPYMAYIRAYAATKRINCAGTIVTAMHILTSARCVYTQAKDTQDWIPAHSINVFVGSKYPFRKAGMGIDVFQVYPHKRVFKERHVDIAILELVNRIQFTGCVRPIQLAGPRHTSLVHELIENGTNFHVVGWANPKSPILNQPIRPKLYRTKNFVKPLISIGLVSHYTQILPLSNCLNLFSYFNVTTMLCSRRTAVLIKARICPGTRGGPLVYNNYQYGVVSSGTCLGEKRSTFIFTRVDTLRGFIDPHFSFTTRYKAVSSTLSPGQWLVVICLVVSVVFSKRPTDSETIASHPQNYLYTYN